MAAVVMPFTAAGAVATPVTVYVPVLPSAVMVSCIATSTFPTDWGGTAKAIGI